MDGFLGTISLLTSIGKLYYYTPSLSNLYGMPFIIQKTVVKAAAEKGWKIWEWDISGSFQSAAGDYWKESKEFWENVLVIFEKLLDKDER
jgi:hypothetical protein